MKSRLFTPVSLMLITGVFAPIYLMPTEVYAKPPGVKVTLTCKNPGSHQDVAKTPIISNPNGPAVPSWKTIYWNSSDNDGGQVQGPLAQGTQVQGLGKPGQNYTCTAYYYKSILRKRLRLPI